MDTSADMKKILECRSIMSKQFDCCVYLFPFALLACWYFLHGLCWLYLDTNPKYSRDYNGVLVNTTALAATILPVLLLLLLSLSSSLT